MSFAAPKTAQQVPVVHDLLYLERGAPWCRPLQALRSSALQWKASQRAGDERGENAALSLELYPVTADLGREPVGSPSDKLIHTAVYALIS
jgi:hypothetical protein